MPPISSLPPFMVGAAVDWCATMSSLDASLRYNQCYAAARSALERLWPLAFPGGCIHFKYGAVEYIKRVNNTPFFILEKKKIGEKRLWLGDKP
ncbi:hypothetical protein Tco_0605603 [Tanacetum coccineum]